jgi:hypothetical protein
MEIRIVGAPGEVAEAAGRVSVMFTVLSQSPPRPRRTGGEASIYLQVDLPDVPATSSGPEAGPQDPEAKEGRR